MGKAVKTVANVATLGALSGGPLSLLGKKDPGEAASLIDTASPEAAAATREGLLQYKDMLGKSGDIAKTQISQMEQQARQNVADQALRAQQLVAQRGLGRTASGIGSILGVNRGLGEQLGNIRASENQLKLQNLGGISSGIASLMGAQQSGKIYNQGRASMGRQGGLAPLLGAGVGAFFGGPGGAQAGLGVGQAATQIG